MNGPIEPQKMIISCSSGNNTNTAISIIRISGSFKLVDFQKIFLKDLNNLVPRMMYLSSLEINNISLDEVMFCFYEGPNSYTGENVLEINCHGNKYNVERIINVFIENFNIRLSKPGEFTLRALKNKKLTIHQVEGLDLLLNAQHSYAFSHGLSLLNGQLSKDYKNIYNLFKNFKIHNELLMDFSDDVGEVEGLDSLKQSFESLSDFVHKIAKRISTNTEGYLNPKLVLFGPVNSGKSTFFNQLLGSNRSIVTDIEGTTRDYISEKFFTGDIDFTLVDTAGLRETTDIVEKKGIERTELMVDNSFYKVFLVSLDNYLKFQDEILKTSPDLILVTHLDNSKLIFNENVNHQIPILFLKYNETTELYSVIKIISTNILFNNFVKQFIETSMNTNEFDGSIGPGINKTNGPMGPKFNDGPIGAKKILGGSIGPGNKIGPIEPLLKINDICLPVDKLLKLHASRKFTDCFEHSPILVPRHKAIIQIFIDYLSELREQIYGDSFDLGIITGLTEKLEESIEELIGIVTKDEVLNDIFSNFCIGK